MQLSYSALETYQQCPLKYKYQYIDRIRTPKSKDAVFGTLVHNTLRFIHEPGFTPPTLEQAIDRFARDWNTEIWDSETEERSAFVQGVEMIRKYYRDNDPAAAEIVALESSFRIDIINPATVSVDTTARQQHTETIHTIKGIIDRIDKTPNGYEIIDYKTARKMPSQDSIDKNLQLTVYLKAFLDRYPKERANLQNITVSLYFVKHGVKLSSTRTEEDLDRIDQLFLDAIQHIETSQFEPRVNPLCDWCGYQKNCPMWRHKFKEERRVDSEEVQKAIEAYIDTKRDLTLGRLKIAKLQELINAYMDQEDVERVFGTAGIIERATRLSYTYDPERLRSMLTPIDRWESILKIDQIALKKVLKDIPRDIRDRIESEAKVPDKETTTFRVKKTSGNEDGED